MGKVRSAAEAGSIVRRIREEKGISRAALSEETGIGTRTLYALEIGEAKNFGLEKYLRLLDALGLEMDIHEHDALRAETPVSKNVAPWQGLSDTWKLDEEGER